MAMETFRFEIPDADYMDRKLAALDKRMRGRILSVCIRAAGAVYRTAIRNAAKRYKDAGDLARSVTVKVRRGYTGYYGLVGFRYGKFGDPPNTSQDPGVYATFLEKGTNRADRGSTRATHFASGAVKGMEEQATLAFAAKFRQRLNTLTDRR